MNAKSGAFAAKASKEMALQSGSASTASIKGGLELLLDATTVKTKMGSITVQATKLPVYNPPESKTVLGLSSKSSLTRPDRDQRTYTGDSLEFDAAEILKEKIASGEIVPKAMTRGLKIDTNSASTKKATAVDTSEFDNYNEFPGSLKLSKYFYLRDLCIKHKESDNQLKEQKGLTKAQIVGNLKHLSVNALDPIKDKYPDMIISSGFRHGTKNSDHFVGQAVDMQFTRHSKADLYEIVRWIRTNIPFKQLLLEYRTGKTDLIVWIHIALSRNGAQSAMPIGTLYNDDVKPPGAINAFVQLDEIVKKLG